MEELEHSTVVSLHATTTEGYQWRRCSATGVTSESLPEVETVSATLKEAILDGKDVNLASLLISLFDLGEYSCYVGGDGSHHLLRPLPSDPHLNRNFTLAEFISAFNKYRNAMCEVWDRCKELDAYEAIVVGIASRIEGTAWGNSATTLTANRDARGRIANSSIRVLSVVIQMPVSDVPINP